MATKTITALLILILASSALADTCDLVGSWRGWSEVTHTSSGNLAGTAEYVFSSNATVQMNSEIAMTDDCKFGQWVQGSYTFENSTYLTINVTDCEYVNCEEECSAFCLLPCTFRGILDTELTFAADCNSFTTSDSSITYWREGAYWWIWFILGCLILCTCCCCCCCCVACVTGCCVGGIKLLTPSKEKHVHVDLEAAPQINYGATDLY